MALPGLPPVIKYGIRKAKHEATGRKWYLATLGARQWKTLMAPIDDVTIVHGGTNAVTLKKKHRRRSDAAAYGQAVVVRYRRLLEALDVD